MKITIYITKNGIAWETTKIHNIKWTKMGLVSVVAMLWSAILALEWLIIG